MSKEQRGSARTAHASAWETLPFLAHAIGGVWHLDAQHQIIYANDVLAQLLGFATGTQLHGLPFERFVFPDDVDDHRRHLAGTGQAACAMREQRLRSRDGTARRCVVSAIQLEDAQGNYAGALALINEQQDGIAARTPSLPPDALGVRGTMLHALYELSPQGLALWDDQGHLLECNPSFRQLADVSAQELPYLSFPSFVADRRLTLVPAPGTTCPQCARHESAIQPCLACLLGENCAGPYEGEYLARDGARRHVRVRLVFMRTSGSPKQVWSLVDDVSEQHHAQAKLVASEERYRLVVDNLNEVIFQTDARGHWVFLNPAWSDITGYVVEDSIGLRCLDFVHPDDRLRHQELFESLIQRKTESCRHEIRYLRKNSGFCWIEACARPIVDSEGRILGTSGTLTDIGARKQAEEKTRLAYSVFTHAREGIVVTTVDATIIEVNHAFERITGYRRSEVVGNKPSVLQSGRHDAPFYTDMWHGLTTHGHWRGEVCNRRKNGEIYVELLTISAVRNKDGTTAHYVGLFSDITRQKEHERRLEQLAHYDALTGLPNRLLLGDRLRQAMVQAMRRDICVVVAYIDLDGFKSVNDTHGHACGDRLLLAIADRLQAAVREADTVSRLGGDEFVVVLNDLPSVDSSLPTVHRLLAAVGDPVTVNGIDLRVSASIGVAGFPQEIEVDSDELLRQADQAMYLAKRAGKNMYHVYGASTRARSGTGHVHDSTEQGRTTQPIFREK